MRSIVRVREQQVGERLRYRCRVGVEAKRWAIGGVLDIVQFEGNETRDGLGAER